MRKQYSVRAWGVTLLIGLSSLVSPRFLQADEGRFAASDSIRLRAQSIVDRIQAPRIPDGREIILSDYAGEVPDRSGSYDFRAAMQEALRELSAHGGGTLKITHPQGASDWFKTPVTYRLSGPIQLQSGVRFAMEPATELVFDFSPLTYNDNGRGYLTRYEGTLIYGPSACLRAFNVSDIEIIALPGSGPMPAISGNGALWQNWMWAGDFHPTITSDAERSYQRLKHEINNGGVPLPQRMCADPTEWFLRPDLFQAMFSKRIRLQGIEFRESPFWVVHPVFSTDLVFRELKFEAHCVNNDGIDPESCRRVLIERVMFSNHDDNIAIKSGRDRDAREGVLVKGTELENIDSPFIREGRTQDHSSEIVIRNNFFKGHYAICVGSEISGGASEIYAIDNTVPQDVKMLLNLKSSRSRGGVVDGVYVSGVKAHRVEDAVVCMIPNYDNDPESPFPPVFRNILVENVEVNEAGRGIVIHGWSDAPVKNVEIHQLRIGKVRGIPVEVSNAEAIKLKSVIIGETQFEKTVNHSDPSIIPPHQI